MISIGLQFHGGLEEVHEVSEQLQGEIDKTYKYEPCLISDTVRP